MADWKEALDGIASYLDEDEGWARNIATIRAHIEGLERQHAEYRQDRESEIEALKAERQAAEARVQELEPNANRYLYLRDNTSVMIFGDNRWLTSHRLDDAIDTEMQASKEGR